VVRVNPYASLEESDEYLNEATAVQDMFPCKKYVPHLIPDWIVDVAEDVEPAQFDPSKLKFISFMREGDGDEIDGNIMVERAVELKANFGLSDVPTLLGEHGTGLKTILAELQGGWRYIVLTGTLLQDADGYLCVSCFFWNVDRWVLCFRRLCDGWGKYDRLVSCE